MTGKKAMTEVEMLEDSENGKKKTPSARFHDLDWMCGAISDKQYTDFSKRLAKTRTIDRELWQ